MSDAIIGGMVGARLGHAVVRPLMDRYVAPRFVAWCHRKGIGP